MGKKNVSAIVSGAGWIGSFTGQLIEELKDLGVSFEDIHKLGKPTKEGRALVWVCAEKIAEVVGALPVEMTVGGRTYEILGFPREDKKVLVRQNLVERVKKMNANLGREDGEHILKYKDEIPASLRGKMLFVFTDWRYPDDPENAFCVYWDDDRWARYWYWLGRDDWVGRGRLLRRK